jgi:hypothetical protein
MFTKPIVVVTGAGASSEFNLPLKADVASDVRFQFEAHKQTSGDSGLFTILSNRFRGDMLESYSRAGNQLANAMNAFISIDEALHYFASSAETISIGKVAIVRRMLRAEQGCMLQIKQGRPHLAAAESTWIAHLFSMALAGIQREKIEDLFSNVTFINFNYDRAVEHYFYLALKTYVGASNEQAANAIAKIKMIRPYGSVAWLPWQKPQGIALPFGDVDTVERDPFPYADNIKTYTEQTSTDLQSEIANALGPATLVLIIGFGFHQQNMNLLQVTPANIESKLVLCTGVGLDELNYAMLTDKLLKGMCSNASAAAVKVLPKAGAELMTALRLMIMGTQL